MGKTGKKSVVFAVVLLFIVGVVAEVQNVNSAKEQPSEWVADPLYISPFAGSATPQGYSPSQMRTAYNLPSSGGNGSTIAIIDAYDTPNIGNYFDTFSNTFGLPDNSTGNFLVKKMTSQTDSGWALETCLDVEWAHAIAPNATILLVEAVNPNISALLSAVDYATHQPGVVAVSMSWGGPEFYGEDSTTFESYFNKPGIAFFASSGDDGSTVLWPAASANVVSVGGTSLYLKTDGTVISEVAWTNSSGGISNYVARPSYQTSLGLTYPNRAVPDVSYDGNASTGVSVYNGTWWRMGGTSAGAPQWAAIHALGLSATNTNLYNRAKSAAYSQYLRDITTGSNYVNNATAGYDLVTGLGSPLTTNFGTEVTLTPSSGPPNGSVTLNGVGFALSSSVNISYLNPINSSWIPLTSNLTITSDTFSYSFNTPDLMQNNTAGDNPPQSDNIVFRVVDNNNNHAYNTTLPYTEWRRGLAQVGNATAQGLFGNNTDLTMNLFVQSGDSVPIAGKWFSPGNVSVLWDNASLGIFSTDGNGFFNASVQVPATNTGQHTLTINDGASNFCLNLTRLPTVANDYVNGWYTSNFTITLTPDTPVNETFYSINGAPPVNVTANGQPTITTEGSNNTLEYWSTWNLYQTGSTVELPHVTITGIKLDTTPPVGSISTNPDTDTPTITLTLSATDATSGVSQMRFSNDGVSWSSWEKYATSKSWTLQGGDGQKTVSVQFMDNAGLTSSPYSCTVTLTTPTPTAAPAATSVPATPTPTPTTTPLPTPNPTPTQTATPTKSNSPDNSSPTISLTLQVIIVLIAVLAVCCAVWLIRKRK